MRLGSRVWEMRALTQALNLGYQVLAKAHSSLAARIWLQGNQVIKNESAKGALKKTLSGSGLLLMPN